MIGIERTMKPETAIPIRRYTDEPGAHTFVHRTFPHHLFFRQTMQFISPPICRGTPLVYRAFSSGELDGASSGLFAPSLSPEADAATGADSDRRTAPRSYASGRRSGRKRARAGEVAQRSVFTDARRIMASPDGACAIIWPLGPTTKEDPSKSMFPSRPTRFARAIKNPF
jgi:hypothetical protein